MLAAGSADTDFVPGQRIVNQYFEHRSAPVPARRLSDVHQRRPAHADHRVPGDHPAVTAARTRRTPRTTRTARLDDADWLRARIAAGARVADLAADSGVTERTVRNHLHRHGIALPGSFRYAHADLDAIFADYRNGIPAARLAAQHSVPPHWLYSQIRRHGVTRDAPLKRRPPPLRYPQLADRRWILEQLADGATVHGIARHLRTGHRTIRHALARHGITPPPAGADPVERLAYLDEPAVRAAAAQRLVDRATDLAARASAVHDEAVAAETANEPPTKRRTSAR